MENVKKIHVCSSVTSFNYLRNYMRFRNDVYLCIPKPHKRKILMFSVSVHRIIMQLFEENLVIKIRAQND